MTETHDSRMCPICRRPKRSGSAGSITQWIATCRCGLQASASTDEVVRVCADCRKRVGTQKGGSITQWIFSDNICKCVNPRLVVIAPGEAVSVRTGFDDDSGKDASDEIALEVDHANFPVDRYKPLKFIGKGALGEVYLCRDVLLKKKVAVKCLLNLSDDSIVSFQNEAKIVSKLQHEDVIRVLDFGTTTGGRPFMVMDYFPGESLQGILTEHGKLEEGELIEVFMQVCRSLQYLHENNVFHRDLKPSNILVRTTAAGAVQIRLIDFGLSKTTQEKQSKTHVDGNTIVGTPAYMSPDQVHGQLYDVRSEVYSLGCVMFEALTGTQPFEGKTALEVLNKHIHQPVPSVHALEPSVSVELCELIEKCLSKSKEDRISSMNAIVENLSACKRASFDRAGESSGVDPSNQFEKIGMPVKNSRGISKPVVVVSSVLFIGFSVFLVGRALMTDNSYTGDGYQSKRVPPRYIPDDLLFKKPIEKIPDKRDQGNKTALERSQYSLEMIGTIGESAAYSGMAIDHSGNATQTLTKMIKSGQDVSSVLLIESKLVPDDVKLIAKIKPIRVRLENCTGITDSTIKALSQVLCIRNVSITGSKGISPKGIAQLSALPLLTTLWVKDCDFTDEHLKEMKKIQTLTYVVVSQNKKVTLKGIKYLGDKVLPITISVDQPSIYLLSLEKQIQLKKEHNIVLLHPEEPGDFSANYTARLGLGLDKNQKSDLAQPMESTDARIERLFKRNLE